MKLKNIYFDSYKSLINEELSINDGCIGIVGINESGKTNILNAIRVLDQNENLNISHSPKINKDLNPKVRFNFELDHDLKIEIGLILEDWFIDNCLVDPDSLEIEFDISYIVEFDIKENKETRRFEVINLKLSKEILILKDEYIDDISKIIFNSKYLDLNEAIVVTEEQLHESLSSLEELKSALLLSEEKVHETEMEIDLFKVNFSDGDDRKLEEDENYKILIDNLGKHNENHIELSKNIDKVEQYIAQNNLSNEINEINNKVDKVKNTLKSCSQSINTLILKENLNSVEKGQLTKKQNQKESLEKELEDLKKDLVFKEGTLKTINTPLKDKYSTDEKYFSKYVSRLLHETFETNLPKVIFWNYSDEFVLQSETKFDEILEKKSLNEIPRPLTNIFRVGLESNSIDDIHEIIKIIQENASERSRQQDIFNNNINRYIKSVWEDYDQELKISLEEHKIRIQFFDPKTNRASYFDMQERSQGAQTFISFLMTIGAEAEQGVINNMILLLDEPEIHLHPSGVRYMLQELINISKRSNVVIYATHSIFMIDRNKFERHVYLRKKNEKTVIHPSTKSRIGFFMQEEVLYKTIDIDLSKDFSSANRYNFVFEGYGDVLIFEKFYALLKNKPFKDDQTSFYQGGKCTQIQKYFSNNPIQLGAKWIFILDSDQPANKLKNFIEGRYKDYINQDIFVFQYSKDKMSSEEIELEDLLPTSLLIKTYNEVNLSIGVDDSEINYQDFILDNVQYNSFNKKIIEKLNIGKLQLEDYKSNFKEKLNKNILDAMSILKTLKEFESEFETFSKWSDSLIKKIIEDLKSN